MMFNTFGGNDSLYIMPVCFHPTTTMLVDDDANFLKQLSKQIKKDILVTVCTDSDEAIVQFENMHQHFTFRNRMLHVQNQKNQIPTLIAAIRNEIYNPNRFKQILTTVIDQNMPNKTGFDLVLTMGASTASNPFSGIPFHSYILLTGASVSDFDNEFANSAIVQNLISKSDPDYISKLLQRIEEQTILNVQWCSYDVATTLSRNPAEKASFLFDGNFLPVLNSYFEKENLCELYLFDRQGSCVFLDENANLSWLFVRNQLGIENSIRLASGYNAPASVIKVLQDKKMILSLYEPIDFESRKTINWDDYLLPATVFESNDNFLQAFPGQAPSLRAMEGRRPRRVVRDSPRFFKSARRDVKKIFIRA